MAASPQLRAKFAYKGGAAENFVSFEADDRFTLLNKDDAGWWRVRNANNQEMYVPATYVEEIVEESTDSQEAVQGNGVPIAGIRSSDVTTNDDLPPPPDSFFGSSFVCESPVGSLPPPPDDNDGILPLGWVELKSDDGETYYYNKTKDISQWEKPAMSSAKASPVTPRVKRRMKLEWIKDTEDGETAYTHPLSGEKWIECADSDGKAYFYCADDTAKTAWVLPEIRLAPKAKDSPMDRRRISSDVSPQLMRALDVDPSPRHRVTLSHTDLEKLAENLERNVPKGLPAKSKKKPAPAPPKGHKRVSSHPTNKVTGSLQRRVSDADAHGREDDSGMLLTPDDPSLFMEGFLSKKKLVDTSKKKHSQRGWTQHYVLLESPYLLFFKDKKHAKDNKSLKSTLPSSLCLQNCQVSIPSDYTKKKYVMQLSFSNGEMIYLQAENSKDLTEWMGAIKDGIAHADSMPPITSALLSGRKFSTPAMEEDFDGDFEVDSGEKKGKIKARLRTFLTRRPTYEDINRKGLIKENVFGAHLDKLAEKEKSPVPLFVILCIEAIESRGIESIGLYRVPGNASQIQKLRFKVDRDEPLDLNDRKKWDDINVLAGALKLFFRELAEPLVPSNKFDTFVHILGLQDYGMRIAAACREIIALPKANKETLKFLLQHLLRVISHGSVNKMLIQNVAIVFGPTLLRPADASNIAASMAYQNAIVEFLLKEYDKIF
ncbi:rho GTPase-activating protein 15-like isoform X2 [Oscarella lobularis]|uniref:rho GTPase-activating protein 15-like isoform X2 n=1 Tax=Oscarella lobularis TaxID=121494 RepID=UPI003313F54D